MRFSRLPLALVRCEKFKIYRKHCVQSSGLWIKCYQTLVQTTNIHSRPHRSYFIHFTCSFWRFERISHFISDCSFVRVLTLSRSRFYSLVRLIKTINVKWMGSVRFSPSYVGTNICVWLPMNKHTITTLWLCCCCCCAVQRNGVYFSRQSIIAKHDNQLCTRESRICLLYVLVYY